MEALQLREYDEWLVEHLDELVARWAIGAADHHCICMSSKSR